MQKPIKICYILPEYNKEISGHFYHNYELLEKLSNPPAGEARKLGIFLIAEKGRGEGAHIQKFRFLPLRFLESFFLILRARMLGYKIFYTHYSYIGAINAAVISRLFGGKSYYWNCAMNWLFKQKTLQGLGYRLSMKLSHYLVTGSKQMKKEYAEHYNLPLEKIKVLPNWINLRRFKAQSLKPKAQKTLLFVHWLSKRKGADKIVPIVQHLKELLNNFKLLVIGEGPYKEKLLKEIEENKLEKYIDVIGPISNKDLAEYYAKVDVFIMPSMEEGFPRVLLEAMAMGVPYVASDVGAVREISPEIAQRFLVKSGDTEKFSHKLEILLTDKKIYNHFREEELKKVKEYSLDKVVDKFIELFS